MPRIRMVVVGVVSAGLVAVPGMSASLPATAAAGAASTSSTVSTLHKAAAAPSPRATASCTTGVRGKAGRTVRSIVKKLRAEGDTRAAIVRVTRGGKNVATLARGTSMTGVPARIDMRFRSGAVAISHLGIALLRLVEQGKVSLDDPVRRWLKDSRIDRRVTLRMLANSTSGIPDYVAMDDFDDAATAHPFRHWSQEQLLAYAFSKPYWYEPGTNWSYSHGNFVLLGQALSAISGKPLKRLLRQLVFRPAGLGATTAQTTAVIPGTALHAYSTARGVYEDSTYWDPSWSLAHGAIETTDICDMARSARVVGRGDLLSKRSYRAMVGPALVGLGGPTATCPVGICRKLTRSAYYGLGVIALNGWIVQNPSFAGYSAVHAYLPSKDLTVAVVGTTTKHAADGAAPGFELFERITRALTPKSVPDL